MENQSNPNETFLDSRPMTALGRIWDMIVLNVIYLFACFPIFTIGAATTALYTVCFRIGTDREQPPVRSFFKAFKDNFLQGTGIWLVLMVLDGLILTDLWMSFGVESTVRYTTILFSVVGAVVFVIQGQIFPLLSQFNNTCRRTVHNAIMLSIAYLPASVLIAVINAMPIIFAFVNLKTFIEIGYVWVVLYFSCAAWLNTYFLRRIYAQLTPTDPEESEPEPEKIEE